MKMRLIDIHMEEEKKKKQTAKLENPKDDGNESNISSDDCED